MANRECGPDRGVRVEDSSPSAAATGGSRQKPPNPWENELFSFLVTVTERNKFAYFRRSVILGYTDLTKRTMGPGVPFPSLTGNGFELSRDS
jgi:hypothetical protein